jgi:hypothetical protein
MYLREVDGSVIPPDGGAMMPLGLLNLSHRL